MAEVKITSEKDEAEKKPEPVYELDISNTVVEKITAYATHKIDGILEMKGNLITTIQEGFGGESQTKGIRADVGSDQTVSVDLSVVIEYGKSAPDVFEKIKEIVGKDIERMTGLYLDKLTVHVVDVATKEDFKKSVKAE